MNFGANSTFFHLHPVSSSRLSSVVPKSEVEGRISSLPLFVLFHNTVVALRATSSALPSGF